MMIDRLSGINPLQNVQKTQHVAKKAEVTSTEDTVAVSDEAKRLADEYMLTQIASETPDIREDRIAEVKAKLSNPDYINEAVLNSTADRFLDSIGL
ncbi:MAG: flagellar biosynthesis anti-sigma factor FlgM [Treponemataceae bacterium]|nr:flagellar biosynthesis anti-sigma factor FlgM [Treponemataceae bacterium]